MCKVIRNFKQVEKLYCSNIVVDNVLRVINHDPLLPLQVYFFLLELSDKHDMTWRDCDVNGGTNNVIRFHKKCITSFWLFIHFVPNKFNVILLTYVTYVFLCCQLSFFLHVWQCHSSQKHESMGKVISEWNEFIMTLYRSKSIYLALLKEMA